MLASKPSLRFTSITREGVEEMLPVYSHLQVKKSTQSHLLPRRASPRQPAGECKLCIPRKDTWSSATFLNAKSQRVNNTLAKIPSDK